MTKLLIKTIEDILNQNHDIDERAILVDSTDNGTFKQAEIQMNGHWVGDVDIDSMLNIPFVEAVLILKDKAKMFYDHYMKAID